MSAAAERRAARDEAQSKLLMVVNALGKPATVKELLANPLLEGMTPRAFGAHMRVLARQKQVKRGLKNKTWGPITSREIKPKVTETPADMYFVINIAAQTIKLDIGGLRLPVKIE
jgi:hypothetical protein